ncbi:MAG: HNH endonuclease [Actinomycetota bacterium]
MPNSTEIWRRASTPREALAATAMSSAWCTSISRWNPHIGTPIVARAEAEAARLARAARHRAPFECHLADAYVKSFSLSGTGRAKRPELVLLVSHEVTQRGWNDVKEGEICKIPGVGPVSPEVAKKYRPRCLPERCLLRRGGSTPVRPVDQEHPDPGSGRVGAGEPPGFDGILCVDCGNRFRTEFDHVQPRAAHGPTSNGNLKPRCWSCHQVKTKRDRRAGKLRPAEP